MRNVLLWGLAYCSTNCLVDAAAALAQGSEVHRLLTPDGAHSAGTIRNAYDSDHSSTQSTSRRRLHGRFLHITDFHPDPFYKTYSSTTENAACHRKRGPAGYYGAETSGCDSPLSLVNATMDWVKKHVADDIDFVIWTGDSARHDNDLKHPRTRRQVITQNELMVDKFVEVFGANKGDGSDGNAFRIPIVPTFGNNDIMPHNILLKGPNEWTMKYLNLWRGMIPEAQRHQFQQGGWYWVEVIPGKLAVVSLNTMYFFSSNSGVDGCASKHEPGYEQFEWLRIQLQIMRDRGVSAILIGHVPPARVNSKESWEETCWQKYALWGKQYRDVIVASLFGHMNIDHFMLEDFKQIKKGTKGGKMANKRVKSKPVDAVELLDEGEVTVASATEYLLDLRKRWAKLPSPSPEKSARSKVDLDEFSDEYKVEKEEVQLRTWQRVFTDYFFKVTKGRGGKDGGKKHKKGQSYIDQIGGEFAERYSVSLVSPSVVPNYFPTMRIFTYNTTGLDDEPDTSNLPVAQSQTSSLPTDHNQHPFVPSNPSSGITDENFDSDAVYLRYISAAVRRKQKDKQKESRKKKRRKHKFKVPKGPSKSSPPGPAYSAQPLTLLGYTQLFANLTKINNDFVVASPSSHAEDGERSVNNDSPLTIFGLALSPSSSTSSRIEPAKWKEGKHHKHQGKKPRPEPHPNKFTFEVEYDTCNDARYNLKDLTVRQWLGLAGRIGGGKAAAAADGEEVDASAKGKKGGKKDSRNKQPWFTFVQRAFVGSMDPREIEEVFGAGEEERRSLYDGAVGREEVGEEYDGYDDDDYDLGEDDEDEEERDECGNEEEEEEVLEL